MKDPDSSSFSISNLISRLAKGRKKTELSLGEILSGAEESGLIDQVERTMMDAVHELDDTIVREIMIPRTQITLCSAEAPLSESLTSILESGHSRVPVYLSEHDNVVGILYAKDLLNYWGRNTARLRVADVMRRPHFVPESKNALALLNELQALRTHIAVVVDEYGGLSGIITVEDVVEEIFGDIHDEFDHPSVGHRVIDENTMDADALVEIEVIEAHFGIRLERDRCETLGGLLFELFGKMPKAGDRISSQGLNFKVEDIHKMRIGRVSIGREVGLEK